MDTLDDLLYGLKRNNVQKDVHLYKTLPQQNGGNAVIKEDAQRKKNVQDPSAPFQDRFVDLDPQYGDIRQYRVDKIAKKQANSGSAGAINNIKINGFITKSMKIKQQMLNGVLGQLDKTVIQDSINAIKQKRKHDKDSLRYYHPDSQDDHELWDEHSVYQPDQGGLIQTGGVLMMN